MKFQTPIHRINYDPSDVGVLIMELIIIGLMLRKFPLDPVPVHKSGSLFGQASYLRIYLPMHIQNIKRSGDLNENFTVDDGMEEWTAPGA